MTSSARILVVDDHEDNRDMLARRLQRRGFEVDTAEDGYAALEKIDGQPYDLIVLDIMMPGLSGLEVLQKLRETYPRAELPILMATAKSESQDMVDALSLGANDYVTKPIDFPVVLARIQAHLQTREQAPSLPAPAATLPGDGKAAPGTVLDGRFRVEEIIGEGGFAIVFRATQLSTGQPVAVKVLRSRRAAVGTQTVEHKRFEREMRTIGKLHHPHVVRLIDFGTLRAQLREPKLGWVGDGSEEEVVEETETRLVIRRLPYIVMEYLEGETFGALRKRQGPLAPAQAVGVMLPVLSAVGAAHAAGVVHRDLKPPNIMVVRGADGHLEPKVLDFGIAKPLDEEASVLTHGDGGLLGTPEYMAPEQIRETREADARADQYALGCILYELLTGKPAFRAPSYVDLLQAVSMGTFPRPRELAPELPEGLEAVVLRAMDAEPERRFSSVEAFGKALLPHAAPEVRARWQGSFAVADDPPPPPRGPEASELPTRSVRGADAGARGGEGGPTDGGAPAPQRAGLALLGLG
ncbi:MAG TPA: response regulator, partial [Polyangiaceae bacterium LLY-WYZ-15_(1-7)]|nr:response regulator [Polyangiaceae bacterium LLY-WYZ-15_(1-7)]